MGREVKLSDFDYNLPKKLIAQYPTEKRDSSRLLVLDRRTKKITHRFFRDIPEYFHKDDLLILNNTKVVPSRLMGKKLTGGRIEALILYTTENPRRDGEYEALLRPTRGCRVGSKMMFGDGRLEAEVSRIENGRRFLRFNSNNGIDGWLDTLGQMPLPPYIKREPDFSDKKRYQTVYAYKKGAIAAPTAGLHFTEDILSSISKKGVGIEYITLHVGYGTFKPVKSPDIKKHRMEKEYFKIEDTFLEKLKNFKGRKIAVGTTSCRTLETVATKNVNQGWTDLFIHPPYKFKAVDALLTNFHLPRTTLFMLVSAFCGRKLLHRAYQEAIERKYRFYSYGDAMLVV